MPKINVYLPDDLAEAVKEAGVPVSAVCQRALEQAVRRVTAIRETSLGDLDLETPTGALTHLTARMRNVLKLAADAARAQGDAEVGTGHLLGAMLAEGANLALHVLRAMEIGLDQVRRDLDRHVRPATAPAVPSAAAQGGSRSFSSHAANALELAVTEAIALGHNYVGCEHLLLGLVAEPDGTAGQVLRALGAEPRLTRRAVSAALAGYVHLRAETQQSAAPAPGQAELLAAALKAELRPIVERLERLETHAGLRP
ncbi:ATP-dependent Clp protease ATP-binding subunit ClpC1 [Nonomuraea coxensis DSM 45129]|uniref:ATP-dependent Clp protease ATP-binding subunit ClpC1 n=1 Tax=Nonomuraea coxensis DSM 45129 TaxID=1122611 RepID=A0ABX8U6S1_9ACTN|nr:Clp protease N-terminal domain-containing protein [Nonomuraea coxensis]QYC43400.1 ATP-dependent Clp protease ATP-binding subunit ClpC1 [Nonomuraea coxensis DSM 45129]